MKTCEDKFQVVANRVCSGEDGLSAEDAHAVSVFSALWRARFERRWSGQSDVRLNGVLLGPNHTVDEQEQLERAGLAFLRGDTMPARIQNGMAISYEVSKMARAMRDVRWGVRRADEGEMILPDTFGGRAAIPVSPTICLFAGMDDGPLSLEEVRALNRIAMDAAVDYVAARDFAVCPV